MGTAKDGLGRQRLGWRLASEEAAASVQKGAERPAAGLGSEEGQGQFVDEQLQKQYGKEDRCLLGAEPAGRAVRGCVTGVKSPEEAG